uniref:Pseudouridine synthase II N-terminal domain-containing protein n=2 Tax=Clastoptera arizonana TaxID=38151 RepID=A0A1B6D0L3_9HEMI
MFQNITQAPVIWRLLNGVICIYKPAGVSAFTVRKTIVTKLTEELCEMECRPPGMYVSIEGDTTKEMTVKVEPNLADHPLVVGPRYQPQDLRCVWATYLGKHSSGVFILGLGNGVNEANNLHKTRPVRTYHITGKLGLSTDDYFITGKVVEKSSFKHVRKDKIDRVTASFQASHQTKMFDMAGVEPSSQEAYELALNGFIRATDKSLPVLYGIKCIKFEPPNFILEVHCVNEYEMYFKTLIHDLGMKLHSNAVCTSIHCIRHSYFTIADALLRKHWTLQEVMNNLLSNRNIIKSHTKTKNLFELDKRYDKDITNSVQIRK